MAVEESEGGEQRGHTPEAVPFPVGVYPEKSSGEAGQKSDPTAVACRPAAGMPAPPPFDLPLTVPVRRERPRVREAGRLVVIALTLGWAFDALCGGGALGVGFPLFFLSLLGA